MLYGTSPEARSKWQKPEEGDRPFPVSSLTGPCLPAPARGIPAPAAPALPERGRLTVCQLEAIREPLLRRDRQQLRARVLPGPPSARRLLKAAARPYTFCQCGGPARMPPPRPALPSAPPPQITAAPGSSPPAQRGVGPGSAAVLQAPAASSRGAGEDGSQAWGLSAGGLSPSRRRRLGG